MRNRRVQLLFTAIAAFAVMLSISVADPSEPVAAHNVQYGWFKCTAKARLQSNPVYVGMPLPGETGAFPADGMGDGVLNSFPNRFADAAARWNSAVLGAAGEPYGVGWAGANTAVIILVRNMVLDAGLNGQMNLPMGCLYVHGGYYPWPDFATLDINKSNYWFTQDDSRRATWEACQNPPPPNPSYTCGKYSDVGSVITHELGHGLGLAHPLDTDTHLGLGNGAVFNLAKCGVVTDQATMCSAKNAAGSGLYRTHRRTLDGWDITSLTYALPYRSTL